MKNEFEIILNEKNEKVLVAATINNPIVEIPSDVIHIGANVFRNKSNIIKIILPKGLKTIGDNAFSNCENAEIKLPEGLESIGKSSFCCCYKLDGFLPNTLKSIGNEAFFHCIFDSLIIPNSLSLIPEGAFCYLKIKNLVFSNNLTKIGKKAFSHISILNTIELPNSLIEIDEEAFKESYDLKKIFIPNSVQIINRNVFKDCYRIKIYCEGEIKEGFFNLPDEKFESRVENYSHNFHSSAGSFDYETEIVTIHNSFNPNKYPIYTNVSLEEFRNIE